MEGKVSLARQNPALLNTERLLRLYGLCAKFEKEGREFVLSKEMAEHLGCSASVVRKDLSNIGRLGTRGRGYRVAEVVHMLRRFLGNGMPKNAVLIGAGNLGIGLLNHDAFESHGIRLVAASDSDPQMIGTPHGNLVVQDVGRIPAALASLDVDIGVLAVPAAEAQGAAEILVQNGVRAILSLAPGVLSLGRGTVVKHVDLSIELGKLAFALGRGPKASRANVHRSPPISWRTRVAAKPGAAAT